MAERERKRYVNGTELADFLNCSRNTVTVLFAKGVIPGYRLGGRALRFDPEAVLAALDEQTDRTNRAKWGSKYRPRPGR
jgi:excisionase family DNA binding protein